MPRYRHALPQVNGTACMADGGLETCLMLMERLDLPCFASFPLIADEAGRGQLERYFKPYLQAADEHGLGFVLDTPTWRANADWGAKVSGCCGTDHRHIVAICEALSS